jgi:hypothetical protein
MLCMHVNSDDMLVQAVFQARLKEHKADQMVKLLGEVVGKTLLFSRVTKNGVRLQAMFQAWVISTRSEKDCLWGSQEGPCGCQGRSASAWLGLRISGWRSQEGP